MPHIDITFATRWDTAFYVLKFNNTNAKFYFIQDDERLLFPGTIFRDLVECTYRFGFIGITNALELKYMYQEEFYGEAGYFSPAPSRVYFSPRSYKQKTTIKSIWFYARTRSDRNGFHLGILALREIKKRHPEVKVYLAGEGSIKPKVNFDYIELGDIKNQVQLASLYANCDVGMYLLFSRHTGVIPFELMASGCITLTNKRSYKTYLLKDRVNCVMGDPTPSGLADAFDDLYYNKNLRRKIIENGYNQVKHMDREKELDKIYEYVIGLVLANQF